jgi:hypothetical protein
LHQLEECVFLFEGPVFRQGASGLPHEPDRRPVHGLALTGIQETLAVGRRCRPRLRLGGRVGKHGGASTSSGHGRFARLNCCAHQIFRTHILSPTEASADLSSSAQAAAHLTTAAGACQGLLRIHSINHPKPTTIRILSFYRHFLTSPRLARAEWGQAAALETGWRICRENTKVVELSPVGQERNECFYRLVQA